MYSFIDYTWNVIKGHCYHDCSYCYMKRWGNLNPVRFDEKELKTDLGTGDFIFIGSSCDMFAQDIPSTWITRIFQFLITQKERGSTNRYLFQSKNPKRFHEFKEFLNELNPILVTTIETNRIYPEIMNNAPSPTERAEAVSKLSQDVFITIEPIMDFDLAGFVELIRIANPVQVNIGNDTGRNGLPEPSKEKVIKLIEALGKFTTVHNKANLKRILETN